MTAGQVCVLLRVEELEKRKVCFAETYARGRIDLAGTRFEQTKDARITGEAELVNPSGEIRVHGHIEGAFSAECDRCLERVQRDFDQDFVLHYRPVADEPDETEVELTARDAEIAYFEGEGLRLSDVVREQVMLWLPMHWLCREDCRGICPICGENRNLVNCDCHPETADERWTALRSLIGFESK